MSNEMETGALASIGGLKLGRRRKIEPGPCSNCGTVGSERFCPVCGQLAADFHRPVWTLVGEGLADSFSLDGRIARTLPALMFRPGHVTRSYLDGKRARYVPPFRLFLLCSLLFFAVFFGVGDRLGWFEEVRIVTDSETGAVNLIYADQSARSEPAELAATRGEDGRIDPEKLRAVLSGDMPAETGEDGAVAPETSGASSESVSPSDEEALQLAERLAAVYDNQGEFVAAIRNWAPRVSLLLLPILALSFALLHFWRRRVYIYDHLITALHLQSFLYLLGAILMLAGLVLGGGVGWVAALGVPVYLFMLLRKTYSAGPIMAGLRTVALLITTSIALLLLVTGILVLGVLEV